MGWAERRGIQKDVTRGGLRPLQGSVAGLNHVEQQSHGHGRGKDAHQRHEHRRQPGSCKFSSHGLGQEQPEELYEHLDAYLQDAWSDDIKVELSSPGGREGDESVLTQETADRHALCRSFPAQRRPSSVYWSALTFVIGTHLHFSKKPETKQLYAA